MLRRVGVRADEGATERLLRTPSSRGPLPTRDKRGRLRRRMACRKCGDTVEDPTAEVMRPLKWQPYEEVSYVNWCGHKQEFIPIPMLDSSFRLVPLEGEVGT